MFARHPRHRRAGFGLVEQMIVVGLFSIVFLASMSMLENGRSFSKSTLGIANVEDLSQQMLYKIERELSNARGSEPVAVLSLDLAAAESAAMTVDSTLGFPPVGHLLLGRGTASEERIEYQFLNPNGTTFQNLGRAQLCTGQFTHPEQSEVIWVGLAEPLANQVAPDADDYDGVASEGNDQVFFRGDGTGFSYRKPVAPTGSGNVVDGDELFWGCEIDDVVTTDGWYALYFEPRSQVTELETDQDLNGDGDRVDVFDLGQIRRRSWDTTDPANVQDDLGMGPAAVLQERCNHGGDLNGDGFEDPIFLWNPATNELSIRLFLLGRTRTNNNLVREVRSVVFLRNEPEQMQN